MPGALQRLGNLLNTMNPYISMVDLNKCFFYRAFTAFLPIDDRAFEEYGS